MSVKSSDPNAPLIIIGLLATGSFFDNRHLDVSRLKGQICQARLVPGYRDLVTGYIEGPQ
jgi:hypothetical protein